MQSVIEDVVQGLGWVTLKALTMGRYRSEGSSAQLFEGTFGVLVIVGATWVAYRWLA